MNTNGAAEALVRFGVPKGSLEAATFELFRRAGFTVDHGARSYFPTIDDPELSLVMFRAQEMSRYVEDGVIDAGITGHDWIVENGSSVQDVGELNYSKATSRPARWVLAVPAESPVRSPSDLEGGIIATELVGTTRRYFEERGIKVRKVEFSWGATEVKARFVSAIVDITETGSSLRANNLRVVDTILTSTTHLIANKQAWSEPAKRQKIEDLATLFRAAIAARSRVGVKMNVPRGALDAVLGLLPSERSPTVSPLADGSWVAVEVIVDRSAEPRLIPQLVRAGASGILSYPLNKIIH